MEQLEDELDLWEGILGLLESRTDEEIERDLTVPPDLIAQVSREASLTLDDLDGLRQMFRLVAAATRGEDVATENLPPKLSHFLRRSLAPNVPTSRRFLPQFEEAFRRRRLAEAEGTAMTAEALAQELIPGEYARNPESAVRNMQQGIARVAREHERCLRLGIPSPFIQPDP